MLDLVLNCQIRHKYTYYVCKEEKSTNVSAVHVFSYTVLLD